MTTPLAFQSQESLKPLPLDPTRLNGLSEKLIRPHWENNYGGSGWVVLGFNQHTRQLENYWMADHAHGPSATLPILVMDMYEHSYQMDFGAAAPSTSTPSTST
jgi:superoxide dismutase